MNVSVTCALEAGERAPVVLRGSYRECIERASGLGYDAVELHLSNPQDVDRRKLRQDLDRNQMRISSLGTGPAYAKYGLSLSSEAESIRKQAVENIKNHINLAKDFGAVVIIGLIKGKKGECISEARYYERLDQSMKECIQAAEENGVVLVLELINRYESDVLNTIEEGMEYITRFHSNHIKLHIDSFHMNIEETDIGAAILKAGNRLGHVHIADSDRWYAGHGHFDFKTMIKALYEAGYQGVLAQESYCFPEQEAAAEKNIVNLKRYL